MFLRSPKLSNVQSAIETKARAISCGEYIFYFPMDEFYEDLDVGAGWYYLRNAAHPHFALSMGAGVANPSAIVVGHIDSAVDFNSSYLSGGRTLTRYSDGAGFSEALNLHEKSWTIRFWIKNSSTWQLSSANDLTIGTAISQRGVDLTRSGGGSPHSGFQTYGLTAYSSATSAVVAISDNVSSATWVDWHRVIWVYDVEANVIKSKINNDAFSETAAPSGFLMHDLSRSLSYISHASGSAFRRSMDELCVQPGYAWTEEDCTSDWNGGAGKTWPDIPNR